MLLAGIGAAVSLGWICFWRNELGPLYSLVLTGVLLQGETELYLGIRSPYVTVLSLGTWGAVVLVIYSGSDSTLGKLEGDNSIAGFSSRIDASRGD